MRKKQYFALPTTRPYGGYKRGRLPSFAPGTPPLSPNPRNHCRASSFPPTTLQIRDRSGLARLFANPRPAFPSATFANPRPAHLHPPHPQAFWKISDSSRDLCYDNPHVEPRTQITAPFFNAVLSQEFFKALRPMSDDLAHMSPFIRCKALFFLRVVWQGSRFFPESAPATVCLCSAPLQVTVHSKSEAEPSTPRTRKVRKLALLGAHRSHLSLFPSCRTALPLRVEEL